MNTNTRKTIWALAAGFLVVVVPTLATDTLLHIIGVLPRWGNSLVGYESALLLATAYRVVFGVLGCYLTARLAPDRPMRHALTGGVLGLVVSTVGAVATWNKGPAFGPHWYPLALALTALPCAWLGGSLYLSRQARR